MSIFENRDFYGRAIVRGAIVAVANCLLLMPAPVMAKDSSKIRADFDNVGPDIDASARIRSVIKPAKSKLKLNVRRLDEGPVYTLLVGGVPRGSFTTNSAGRGKLRFKPGENPLDFDPRGELVEITDGVATYLSIAALSGEGEPDGIKVDERTDLQPTALAPAADGEARFRSSKGRERFKVEVEDLPPGDYDLFVGGFLRAVITVSAASGEGEVEFDTQPQVGKLPLDFDPRGETVDIIQGLDVFFTSVMQADGDGVSQCEFSESELPVAATAAAGSGTAKARLRTRDDCDKDFRVEIEDVPLGDYDLLIGGVLKGTLTVVDTGTEIEGRLEFDTDPDDPGELLLDFDPRGQNIEIVQGATVFFSDNFDPSSSGGGGTGTCTFEETEILLSNLGVFPGGNAEARFRIRDDCDEDLRVQIEDVPVGTYDVSVGGFVRGQIEVVDVAGQTEGQIEFDTDPDEAGEVLLDFNVAGEIVEISQGGTMLFSGDFDGGPGGGGPPTCQPQETEVPLLNENVIGSAKGEARFRVRDDCDEDLRIEIEDVPLGDYDVAISGIVRGSISVIDVAGENEGQIEFDTDPDEPGEVLLDFGVSGELIEVLQGPTVILDRVFP